LNTADGEDDHFLDFFGLPLRHGRGTQWMKNAALLQSATARATRVDARQQHYPDALAIRIGSRVGS